MLSFFPRGVLGEMLNLTESVSEGFPSYSYRGEALLVTMFLFFFFFFFFFFFLAHLSTKCSW